MSLTHFITHSIRQSLGHSLTLSVTQSPTMPFTHFVSHSVTRFVTHSVSQSHSGSSVGWVSTVSLVGFNELDIDIFCNSSLWIIINFYLTQRKVVILRDILKNMISKERHGIVQTIMKCNKSLNLNLLELLCSFSSIFLAFPLFCCKNLANHERKLWKRNMLKTIWKVVFRSLLVRRMPFHGVAFSKSLILQKTIWMHNKNARY